VTITPEDEQLSNLVSGLELMSSKVMPKTYKAFKMAAAVLNYTWKSYALGAPIPGSSMRLKNPTGAYARSIKTRFLTPFNYEIFSDSPIAIYLEKGTKQFDMKKTHPFGKRSRVVKKTVKRKGVTIREKGDPYLVIPFRYGVPGTKSYGNLPEQVYERIRQVLARDENMLSVRTKGRKHSPNYEGELVSRAKYKWGARFTGTGFEQLEGLVVMDVSTPKSSRSQYMTFRVISAKNSPAMKWIVKARPAMEITKHVVVNTQNIIATVITSGMKQDLGMT